jgi:hypothetical protein
MTISDEVMKAGDACIRTNGKAVARFQAQRHDPDFDLRKKVAEYSRFRTADAPGEMVSS